MAKHLKFIARTVMVQEGNVEGAYRTLNRILTMDGLIEDIKRRRYYEKPCRRRQRESYETCRRIYNMEMARKINFLMRKNRADPWQGCWGPWIGGPVWKPLPVVCTSFLPPIPFTFLKINSITYMQEAIPVVSSGYSFIKSKDKLSQKVV